MPAILDSIFYKVFNTTSTLIGDEGEVVSSHEVVSSST